ncbi:MAG: methyltransferase [Sphingomonadales bacterium]|nr:methyltransferase [Sphingomonadales bacterium]
MTALTADDFLGGRLTLAQPKAGLRAGSDSVFLAAAVAARPGERVLDVGTGCGVVALLVAYRLPGVMVDALEVQPSLVELASANAEKNGLGDRVRVVEGDLAQAPRELPHNAFDWVVSNPPYHDPAAATAPPDTAKARAHMETTLDTRAWVAQCLKFLKPKGRLAVIQRADRLADVLAGLSGKAGDIEIMPLWPKAGAVANRVIVLARKGGKGPLALTPGLVLHGEGGAFTPAAEAILRHGSPFPHKVAPKVIP